MACALTSLALQVGYEAHPHRLGDYWNWDGGGNKRDRLRRSEMIYVNGAAFDGVLTGGNGPLRHVLRR